MAPPPSSAVDVAKERALEALQERHDAQAAQIQELESRLALARAEAADLRSTVASERQRPESIRIGGASRQPAEADQVVQDHRHDDGWLEPWDEGVWHGSLAPESSEDVSAPPDADAPRPLLRLHGTPPQPEVMAAATLPPIPVHTPLRLPSFASSGTGMPMAQLPLGSPGFVNSGRLSTAATIPTGPPGFVASGASANGPPSSSPAVAAYRGALRHLTDQRFGEALRGFDAFLRSYPSHPYAQHAMYWRGEALYARRAYRQARSAFQSVLSGFPQGNKVPDAMLKVALCYFRLGQQEKAVETLARLRRDHPDSVAAQSPAAEQVERRRLSLDSSLRF